MANLNGKDNTFTLKDSLFKDLQKDWPGYTEGDQQLLKRVLVRYVTGSPQTHTALMLFLSISLQMVESD